MATLRNILKKPRHFFFQNLFKQDVLIFVNNGGRDVLGLLLVYTYLKYRYKIRVKIFSVLFMHHYWIKFYRPSVVMHISVDCPSTIKNYKLLKEMGSIALMSPTEVFAAQDPRDLMGKYDYKNLVDGVLLPGERMGNILLENDKISAEQAILTGYPTFDLTSQDLRKFFLTKKEFCRKYNISENKKLILFISSFTLADIDISEWDKTCFNWPESLTKERTIEFAEDAKQMRFESIVYLSNILKKHTGWHLIVRKHPFEESSIYRESFKNSVQVTYTQNDIDINDLISASDVVVHWNSTVSAQAWGFDKNTVLLDLGKKFFVDDEEALSQKGNYVCSNENQLENALSEVLSGKPIPESQLIVRKQFMSKYFMGMDGKSAKRVSETVRNLISRNNDRNIKFFLSTADIIRAVFDYINYRSSWFIFLLKIKFQSKSHISPKNQKYDNFILELYRMRFEKKLKKYLENSN